MDFTPAVEQSIVKQALLSGNPIPARIKNKPVLHVGLDFFLNAFYELTTDRPVAPMGGLMPIPWSVIHNYALAYNMAGEDYEDLLYFIRQLDEVFISEVSSRNA